MLAQGKIFLSVLIGRSPKIEMKRSEIEIKARRISLLAPVVPEMEEKMITLPTIDMVATGRNIMRLREQAGFSVRDLQDVFGFATPQAIYKWQHGAAMPTIDNLVVLAAIFGVAMDDIVVVDRDVKAQISA